MAVTKQQVAELYVATFNRAPDADGLDYWVNLSGLTIEQIAQSFFDQAETQALYPTGTTNAAFVTSIYTNLFARTPDAAGLAYWKANLDNNVMTRSVMIEAMKNGALGADAAIIQNKATVGLYYADAGLQGTDFSLASVTAFQSSVTAAKTSVDSLTGAVSLSLTTGVDTIVGTAGNDVINATGTTLTLLDTIDGGAGNDTMNIISTGIFATPANVSVTSVETVNARGALAVTLDTHTWTGTTAANVTQATDATVVAAATTAISVSGATGNVIVDGGSTQTVTTAGGDVTLGNIAGAAGVINVTHTALNGDSIYVYGGTDVTVTATGAQNYGYIQVGDTSATTNPTGTVNVTSTSAATTATTPTVDMGNVYVYGGTTVNVAQHAAASTSAATNTSMETVNQGYVGVENTFGTITSVTSTQDAVVSGNTYTAATPAAAATTVAQPFSAIITTGFVTYAGLTFTAYAGTTAAQTAAAFANLTSGAIQGSSTLGTYSGTYAGFGTGAVTTAAGVSTVLATTAPATPAEAAIAGVQTVNNSGIGIYDSSYNNTNANDTIATVTVTNADYLDFYGTALTTLSVTNSGYVYISSTWNATTATNTVATTLNATVNNLQDYFQDSDDQYTALNITTAGADSVSDLYFDAMTALTVSGTNAIDMTGSSLAALKTVTVSGAAGVTLNASGTTVTDFNAAATSGNNTVTIDATKATYEGGTGVDTVTTSAGVSEVISLGAGNDRLTLANGTTAVTAAISGGAGTEDALVMVAADAVTASLTTTFATMVTGFEGLGLTGGALAQTVDAAKLGGYNYVVTGGEATGGVLTIDGMASGGTLELMASAVGTGAYAVTNTAWATPTTDSFKIVLSSDANIDAGTVTANKIETLNITSTDTDTGIISGANANTLTVAGDTVTAITVAGNAALTLTSTAALVTTVNASSMTAGFTYTASGTTAQTVTGSATASNDLAAKTLVAFLNPATTADKLIGGSAADTLTANAGMNTLTGGAGADTFVITAATANVNTYSTITDATAGDSIQFTAAAAASFNATALTLGDTAVFQDYANLAASSTATDGALSWFQFANNTYIVQNNTAATSFDNGSDMVVKLTGLVDLSHASLNTVATNLLIG